MFWSIKAVILLFLIGLSSIGAAQPELRIIGEFGMQKSIYRTTSNNSDLIPVREVGIPASIGVQFQRKKAFALLQYEIRNFQEAGPSYRSGYSGLNGFGISLFNYIHSINASIGIDLLKSFERIEFAPEIGFGFINAYPIIKRDPTANDSDNYSRFSVSSVEDSTLSQSGHMHAVYTSRFIPWARLGMRLSYRVSSRIIFHTRLAYTQGFVPFYKAKFRIEDAKIKEPITGITRFSGTSFGIRLGVSYCFLKSPKIQKQQP